MEDALSFQGPQFRLAIIIDEMLLVQDVLEILLDLIEVDLLVVVELALNLILIFDD